MKKIKYLAILLFFVYIPGFFAAGISDYYIDYKVLDNGDMHVRELFILEGVFNGYERIILFENTSLPQFDGSKESFVGSKIYNAGSIEVVQVALIPLRNITSFADMEKPKQSAIAVNAALSGDSHKYVQTNILGGLKLRIYNPSHLNNAFFIEYIVKDVAVVHDDVAEIKWNIFSDQQQEIIRNLMVQINLPNNQTEARIWGHGPLYGETSIVDMETFILEANNLEAFTPVDFRVVFDQEVVSNSIKKTDAKALPFILEIETKLAEEANLKREEAIAAEKRRELIGNIVIGAQAAWFLYLLKLLGDVRNHIKPYASTFNTKYFRDFPNDYNPTTVSYLLNQRIEQKDISAMILDLVERGAINYKKGDKNDYIFSKNEGKHKLTKSEEYLSNFLFSTIGKDNSFKISDTNKYARNNSSAFLRMYNSWVASATQEAQEYNFFYGKSKEENKAMNFSLLGFILMILGFIFDNFLYSSIVMAVAIIVLSYVGTMKKRTKEANESYRRWKGLKNFLDDFGNFSERELPKIELWGKYLVYAVVFGNAEKLSKKLTVKFDEMPDKHRFANNALLFGNYRLMDRALASGFRSSVNTANRAVSSSSSSSGGFGGGFSGGGGFGGGGGGGGRF